jgi:hypothetical protein
MRRKPLCTTRPVACDETRIDVMKTLMTRAALGFLKEQILARILKREKRKMHEERR